MGKNVPTPPYWPQILHGLEWDWNGASVVRIRLTYLLTYSTEHSLSWEANRFKVVKKFLAFYGTRKFITAFTSGRHHSLYWASSIQSMLPHPTSWRSILILSSHLCLDLTNGFFFLRFPHQNPVNVSPLPIRAASPAHLIFLDFITRTILSKK